MENRIEKERYFSVELNSKTNLKNVTFANSGNEKVLVEGSIGRLHVARFVEAVILEVVGEEGVLRINLEKGEIKEAKPQ